MKPELKYIELKSGFGDTGPAWIGMAEFSKSGRTVYFNGKALKNSNAQGIAGNYYDIESGDEYWISGIKKNGTDRHWAGDGKIMIDRKVVDLYFVLGLIQMVLSVYWIYEMISLYYKYHYTDILFAFMYPNWVLFLNILLSLMNLYFGIKLLNGKIPIKRSYLTMLTLIIIGGLINILSVA